VRSLHGIVIVTAGILLGERLVCKKNFEFLLNFFQSRQIATIGTLHTLYGVVLEVFFFREMIDEIVEMKLQDMKTISHKGHKG
jgi:hypothetical protein